MQPNSNVKFDQQSFDIIKRTIRNISVAHRGRKYNPAFTTNLPAVVGLKLTNKCNLRCSHCYEWNEDGYHRDMEQSRQNMELDFDIVAKIMKETCKANSSLYLWGGEPLYYRHFDQLASLIETDRRITAICTNGIAIEEKMDAILKMGSTVELLIAVDGFESENDAIRGHGTFHKVVSAIDTLAALRKKQIFGGKISIHMVMNEKMVNRLYDFVDYFEHKGIDSLILCFPWYISPETSMDMSRYFDQNFAWLKDITKGTRRSWDAFKYRLDHSFSGVLMNEFNRINQRKWGMRIRYQPALRPEEIGDFLEGKQILSQNRTKCLSISTRMDVLPDGAVSSCKHFPEFAVGSLKESSMEELWNCEKFTKIRKIIDSQLMPVCSKCNNLYLHGADDRSVYHS